MSIFDGVRSVLAPPEQPIREVEPSALQRTEWQAGLLVERIAELELALDEQGWTELSSGGFNEFQFTREWLRRLSRIASLMYLSNALIRRGVNVRGYYCWGQGVEIEARNEQVGAVINAIMEEPTNAEEFFDGEARLANDVALHNDGNLFTACFTDPSTGFVRLRVIPSNEIMRIITDPEDTRQVRYYLRDWLVYDTTDPNTVTVGERRQVLYPDINYRPSQRPPMFGTIAVDWNAPVAHLKTGGLKHQQFGMPVTYAALDWARAHRAFLEDFSALMRSLSRFAWTLTTKGKVADAKSRLATTFAASPDGAERNPAAAAGSVFVKDEGVEMTPIPKTGAATQASDNREFRIMVAAALDLPEHLLSGDVDTGNLATARTLDRPTELMVGSWQRMWADYYRGIFGYVVRASVRAPSGALTGTISIDPFTKREVVQANYDTTIDVTFPDILEHDRISSIDGIVKAATLGAPGVDAGIIPRDQLVRLLLTALGVEDVEGIIDDIDTTDAAESGLAQAVRQLAKVAEEARL